MKILLDTNVILDALMNRAPWAASAQALLIAAAQEEVEGYITASSFTDIYYILNKRLKDRAKTKTALLDLISVVKILDVTGKDCEDAFNLPMPDYEDALLAYCALRHKIQNIVTRNADDYGNSPVKAISPNDLLKMIHL